MKKQSLGLLLVLMVCNAGLHARDGEDSAWFVDQSARLFSNFGHLHVGVVSALGANLEIGKIGLGIGYRPAAWSNFRTPVETPDGQEYKGQTQVGVGQQFGWMGLFFAPAFDLGQAGQLILDLPLHLGLGILGTPLQGEDRSTPNNERVSEIEDWLLRGEDISFSFAVDVGARIVFFPWRGGSQGPHGLGFTAGVHLTLFPFYDGFVYDAEDVTSIGGSVGFQLSL